jgi:hypothetical protein
MVDDDDANKTMWFSYDLIRTTPTPIFFRSRSGYFEHTFAGSLPIDTLYVNN